jgi:hypothetical protein
MRTAARYSTAPLLGLAIRAAQDHAMFATSEAALVADVSKFLSSYAAWAGLAAGMVIVRARG